MVSRAVPYHKLLSITTTFQTAVTLNCVCRCGGGESGTRVFRARLTELQADQPAATPPKPSSRFRSRASQTPRTDSGTSTSDLNPTNPSPQVPPRPCRRHPEAPGRGESVVNGTSSSRDSHAPPRARSRPLRPRSRLRSLRPAVREPPRAEDASPILTG